MGIGVALISSEGQLRCLTLIDVVSIGYLSSSEPACGIQIQTVSKKTHCKWKAKGHNCKWKSSTVSRKLPTASKKVASRKFLWLETREWPPPPTYKTKIWTNIWTKYDPKCFKTRQTRQYWGHIFVHIFAVPKLCSSSPKGGIGKVHRKEAWISGIGRISSRQPPLPPPTPFRNFWLFKIWKGRCYRSLFRGCIADWNVSSAELESGNALGAFLQTPAAVLDKISGPMGARFLSSTGLWFGTLIARAQFSSVPRLDKNRSPSVARFSCDTLSKSWETSCDRVQRDSVAYSGWAT